MKDEKKLLVKYDGIFPRVYDYDLCHVYSEEAFTKQSGMLQYEISYGDLIKILNSKIAQRPSKIVFEDDIFELLAEQSKSIFEKSICVSGISIGEDGEAIIRGVETNSGKELFYSEPFNYSHEITELFALIQGIQWINVNRMLNYRPIIFTSSTKAIQWFKNPETIPTFEGQYGEIPNEIKLTKLVCETVRELSISDIKICKWCSERFGLITAHISNMDDK